MEVKRHIWEDRIFPDFDDNLVMHFEIPIWNDELEYKVSTKVFWNKNKDDNYIPKEIFTNTPCAIECTFKNGIIIRGTLEIKKFSSFHSKDSLGIFADFYYYNEESTNYIWHTEGFLVSFDPKIPIPPDIGNTVSVSVNSFNDLFPYIYLSGWPKITASERLFNFFYYKPFTLSPPIFTFSNTLISLKSLSDRQGMQTESISFIEGTPPYQFQYVNNVNILKGYIGNFKPFYDYLAKEKNLTLVVAQTCTFFSVEVVDFQKYLNSKTYLENKEKLWESYFALIIEMGYENENLISIIEVLTLCNFLEIVFDNVVDHQLVTMLESAVLLSLFKATIVLDKDIFPLPPYQSSPPVSTPNIILPYAIGDLQLVKYKLLRYETGELASVTSIMPGEKRKLVNRKLDRVIDKEVSKTTSITESFTAINENNNDFNEELWNTIAETTETTNYPDPGLISTYGPPTNITIKGTYTKTHTTQTPNKKQLSSFAKKVLNKTTQRLSEKVNKVRAHTELKELENTSVSLVNNSNNKEPVYGMYCWLNKIYQTEVVNYGNRMLFSFIIPNPAAAYIEQTEILNGTNFQEPKSLKDFKIETYQDVTKDNYLLVSQYYQLKKFPLYPQENIVVSDVVTLSQSKLITLPDLYFADRATIEYAFGSGTTNTTVSGFLGENTFTFSQATSVTGTKEFKSLNKEQGKIAVSTVYSTSIQVSPPSPEADFQMGVNISCTPLPQTILAWQIEMYQLLYEAYTKEIAVYNLKIGTSNTKKETVNPLSERLTVKLELEKGIRKQLIQNALQTKGLSINKINAGVNDNVQYNQSEIIQYLNTALEWNEMSYTFFDEYDNQNGLFSVSSLSPDFFSAFLKAGYARVIIPVSPEFNYGFLYFLNTGVIWDSKDDLAPCFDAINDNGTINPDQLSIVYELKKTFHKPKCFPEIIDSWEVQVPTSMQILQNKKHLKIKEL
ncbi:hypothetical protein ACSTS3_08705 [Aquimarina muelleri]|uniref:hypothetical protein n=1 Tax=Aquimarina muelleri TaxID=279356 RepID=UPI003F688325